MLFVKFYFICYKSGTKVLKQYKLTFPCLCRPIVFRYHNHPNIKNEILLSHILRDPTVARILQISQPIDESVAISNKWVLSVSLSCVYTNAETFPWYRVTFLSDFYSLCLLLSHENVDSGRGRNVYFWFAWRGWEWDNRITSSHVLSIKEKYTQ